MEINFCIVTDFHKFARFIETIFQFPCELNELFGGINLCARYNVDERKYF